MKPRYFHTTAILLVLLTSLNALAQEATMQETEEWLNKKLEKVFVKRMLSGTAEVKTQNVKVNECECTVTSTEAWGSSYPKGRVYEFEIRNVRGLYLLDPDDDQITTLSIDASDTKYTYSLNGKFVRNETKGGVAIEFQDVDIAGRVNKAFEHYVKLCKEKKEKF